MELAIGDVLRNRQTGLIRVAAWSYSDPKDGEKYVFLRSTDDCGELYEMGNWSLVSWVSKHYIKLKI